MGTQPKRHPELVAAWSARAKLHAEGDTLDAESDRLQEAGDTQWSQGDALCARAAAMSVGGDVFRAVNAKRLAKIGELQAEAAKVKAQGNMLRAKAAELRAEASKLWSAGRRLFLTRVIEIHGNIGVEWTDGSLHLENGEVYRDDD